MGNTAGMTKLKDKGMMVKFFKIACLLFSMFFFSFNAFADDVGIIVSGPDILTEGACYSAMGGTAPYLWKTSAGSIDDSGCVNNVLAQCGTAAITASDDCRATGSKTVNLHSGALIISGPNVAQNGSQYTASGGVEPYSWAITKGSITQNGVVTVSGQCGAATVIVTDSCGHMGTLDVRMPNGKWVRIYYDSYIGYSPDSCSCTGIDYITIIGNIRNRCITQCCTIGNSDLDNFLAAGGVCSIRNCSETGGCVNMKPTLWIGSIQEWRCQ